MLYGPLYGLKQSGPAWQHELNEKLEEMGLKASNCKMESCVYIGSIDGCNVL